MKKEILIGLIGVILVLGISGFYLSRYSQQQKDLNAAVSANQITGPLALTASEVAKHAVRSDCWVMINNNVYNVTGYIASHPGGAPILIQQCGQDATQAYDTKGGSGVAHSGAAHQDLQKLLVGALGSTVNAQQIQNTNNANNFSGGEDD